MRLKSLSVKCLICGNEAHGVHFGVYSCRSCAAFFRRCVVLKPYYRCAKVNKNCTINYKNNEICRHCRFQKCVKVGMTSQNIQLNRDSYTSHLQPEENNSLIHRNEINLQDKFYQNTVLEQCENMDIKVECEKIFQSNYPHFEYHLGHLNTLEKVACGLEKMRRTQLLNIKIENRLSFENLVPHWRNVATKMAMLWMHSWAFRNIKENHQLRIFKCMWKSLYRLERLQMTVEIFGKTCINEKKLIISCKRAIQLDSLYLDIEGISRDRSETTLQKYKTYANRLINEVAKPMIQLKLEPIELAWLLCIFCVHNEDDFLGEEVVDTTNQFADELCKNLHKYYESISLVRYCHRIHKMMQIIAAMKRIHNEDLEGSIFKDATTDDLCAKFMKQFQKFCT